MAELLVEYILSGADSPHKSELAPELVAELGELVTGRKPGWISAEEITIFDSTGTAIQDVASAAWGHQRAIARQLGAFVSIGVS